MADTKKLATAVGTALRDPGIANGLRESIGGDRNGETILQALEHLVDQVTGAPDYSSIGKGWFHPSSRVEYRDRSHEVFARSQERQEASREDLVQDVQSIIANAASGVDVLGAAMIREIGAENTEGWQPTLDGIIRALKSELLMPLRALNECDLTVTMEGGMVPSDHMQEAVSYVTRAVLEGRYPEAIYEHPAGAAQLAGLAPKQVALWKETSETTSVEGLVAKDEGGLEVFWATKIGGPSHGFDYEGQCLMPLVSNARHKVVLIFDPKYEHNAAGRAHLRVLHRAVDRKPLLYLEPTNVDFLHGSADHGAYHVATVFHAMRKAHAMGVPLSMERFCQGAAQSILSTKGSSITGRLESVRDALILAPSTGVVEASDTLTAKHDWVQIDEEKTHPLSRVVYFPN